MLPPDAKLDPLEDVSHLQNARPLPQIDPIQYAWSLCNQGVALPAALARSAFRDPTADRTGGKLTAAKVAIHSGIIRPRMPRPHRLS